MRTLSVVAVCLFVLGLAGIASAELVKGEVTTIPHPSLSVSGEGMVEVAPDTARVTASIVTEGETVEQARERNAQIVQRALKSIKALKLKNVMTKTLNYTMERVTRDADVHLKVDSSKWDIPWKISGTTTEVPYFSVSVPVTLGYRASNSLTVRVQGDREYLSAAAGKIIDALMDAGTNQITSVEYSLEKDDGSAMREAMQKAVKNAQMMADTVSAAAGRKIVGIRNVSPGYNRPTRPVMVQGSLGPGGPGGRYDSGTPTTVTAGMLTVNAQVSIQYELDYNEGDTKFLQ